MLSGESANGSFPDTAVATMAKIVTSAEIGVNNYGTWEFLHEYTKKPVGTTEAVASCAAKTSNEIVPGLIVVFSEAGMMPGLIAKYRPTVPVMVLTTQPDLARRCACLYGVYPYVIEETPKTGKEVQQQVWLAMNMAVRDKLCVSGKEVIVITSTTHLKAQPLGDKEVNPERQLYITTAPGRLNFDELGVAQPVKYTDKNLISKTLSLRAVNIDLDMLIEPDNTVRKSKICATLGPSLSTVEAMTKAILAGLDVARINLAHGTYEANKALVNNVREAAKAANRHVAVQVGLTPPVMYTSSVVDKATGQPVPSMSLAAQQKVVIYLQSHAKVAASPSSFVGWNDAEEGARVGIAWWFTPPVLNAGDNLMIAEGNVVLRVVAQNGDEFECVAVNTTKLGAKKNCCVEGRFSTSPSLSVAETADLKFCAEVKPDFVEISRVMSREFICNLRDSLDRIKLTDAKIIANISSADGVKNIQEILDEADGINVFRGALGLEITAEKVLLASKVLTTKANVAGKPVFIARQILHSMMSTPRPTRAEMTDVANCVIDGADGIMLASETATGDWPVATIETAAAILSNAESACNYYAMATFVEDFTAKPLSVIESVATTMSEAVIASMPSLAVVVDDEGEMARFVSKYRTPVPTIVVTSKATLARQAGIYFGQYPMLVDSLKESASKYVDDAVAFAREGGMFNGGGWLCCTGRGRRPRARSR